MIRSANPHFDHGVVKVVWANSLPLFLLLVVALFSFIRPDTYLSTSNAQMIATSNAVLALLALAAVPPLVAGEFDMSIGFTLALGQSLTAGLITFLGLPPPVAILLVLAIGLTIGFVNGVLVSKVGLNAFIATLSTGIIVQGFTQLYTNGSSIFGKIPQGFLDLGRGDAFGVPFPLLYVLFVAAVMSIIYRYSDWGRQCFSVGGNRKAANLIGIPVERLTIQSYMAAGFVASLAGILSVSILGSANPNIGLNYLLPAFAAVFLGAAPAGPGRFNAWGSVCAVYALAAGIAGLQQLGAAFYVEQFFNGGALLAAITLARATGRGVMGGK
jgi:ribose transport system permease protein